MLKCKNKNQATNSPYFEVRAYYSLRLHPEKIRYNRQEPCVIKEKMFEVSERSIE